MKTLLHAPKSPKTLFTYTNPPAALFSPLWLTPVFW